MAVILVLSGHPHSGKSTLAKNITRYFDFTQISTSKLLSQQLNLPSPQRNDLITSGDSNDKQDDGLWIVKAVSQALDRTSNKRICLDRVRKQFQLEALRKEFNWQIFHVHIDCPRDVLLQRHQGHSDYENVDFDTLFLGDQYNVDQLKADADFVIDSSKNTELDIVVRVAGYLKLLPPPDRKCVDVLIGGQYGSEGKGQVAAYLSREYDVHVRVGGPNAGHTVLSESGKFTYHHLPSGCKDSNAQILIGAGAVLNVTNLLREISDTKLSPDRLGIDPDCAIISAEDIENESAQLKDKIGSTAQGVGFAAARKITNRGSDKIKLAKNCPELKPFLKKVIYELEKAYALGKKILLEGTQGSGLSIHHGEYPYVTSRETNVAGCLAEAGISPARVNRIILVCRTYPIRVASPDGATSGSLSREITIEEICSRSGVPENEAKDAERTSTTRRPRRFGEFDWYLFRKSCALNAPTDIALTFADYISVKNRHARRYNQLTPETILFIEELERLAHCQVSLISTRFAERAIIDRRHWGEARGDNSRKNS